MQKILTLSLIMLFGIAVSACQSQPKTDEIAEVEEWNPTGLGMDEEGESTLTVSPTLVRERIKHIATVLFKITIIR